MVESLTHLGRSGEAVRRRVLGEEVARPRPLPTTDNASLRGSSNGSPSTYQVYLYSRRKVSNLVFAEVHGFVEDRKNLGKNHN